MLCCVYLQRRQAEQKNLCIEYLNPLPAMTNVLLHQVFVCKTHVIFPLNSGDALQKKTSQPIISTKMLDGLKGCLEEGQRSCASPRPVLHFWDHQIELTSHFGIKKSSKARCQEILAVAATDTYLLLKQLGRDCLCLPTGRTWITIRFSSLSVGLWK